MKELELHAFVLPLDKKMTFGASDSFEIANL